MLANALYRHDRRDRERIDRWWAAGGDDRDRVWRGAWFLLRGAFFRFGNHEQPKRVAPVLEFLLEPEPTSPYLPRVRLTTCLPQVATDPPHGEYFGDPDLRRLVAAALEYPDPVLRQRLADLLSVTDQPGLLDALEVEFRLRARPDHYMYLGVATRGFVPQPGQWLAGVQGRFLQIVLANPNLPRPPGEPGDIDLALLALLKDRSELLPLYDQGALAERLLQYLGTWLPEDIHARCRRALRELSDRAGVAVVCDQAVLGVAEAVAAARDARYRPADAAFTPVFLLLTGQFEAYRASDPDGRLLQLACTASGTSLSEDVILGRVLAVLDRDPPADVVAAVRRSLRDLGPTAGVSIESFRRGSMRRAVLARALELEPEAVAAVVEAGYVPEHRDDEELLPLLFLTGQFERYDREDPDGTRLRTLLAAKRHRYKHRHFRTVAERAGRPDPWPPEEPPRRSSRSSTNHGTSGPSSYTGHDAGGYGGGHDAGGYGGHDGGGGHGGGGFGGGSF
ncbi:hypothetical protein GCM10027610_034390 [Dactylosporangium cerinum]